MDVFVEEHNHDRLFHFIHLMSNSSDSTTGNSTSYRVSVPENVYIFIDSNVKYKQEKILRHIYLIFIYLLQYFKLVNCVSFIKPLPLPTTTNGVAVAVSS